VVKQCPAKGKGLGDEAGNRMEFPQFFMACIGAGTQKKKDRLYRSLMEMLIDGF
tara:strand:- start:220224 stop:220385 length:162 start_codon:yes stop_codon:yes gene_type:complete